jgi:stringent starvation protein B
MAEIGPKRPYLLRAMHEWMTDNGLTPFIVVDAAASGVDVPERYITDGKIILNISYRATDGLSLGAQSLRFKTRFGGIGYDVDVPVLAVLGIYAQETGQGMIFTDEEPPPIVEEPEQEAEAKPERGRPDLKLIK